MIKYLLLLALLIPNFAKADFGTGLLLGTMLSSGPRTTKVEVKDEFAKQVEQIESSLPSQYAAVTQPTYTFYVEPKAKDKYLNYFKNGGYNVSYQEGTITFDLSSRYQNYLSLQKQRLADQKVFDQKWENAKPYVKGLGYFALAIFLLVALVQALSDMHRFGVLGWFIEIETKLIKKILNDLSSNRKK